MKQFSVCLGLSILFYISGSFVGKSFNPMDWTSSEGTAILFCCIIFVWIAPITINYLNGEDNFE